jgi:hypothetical protein
MARIYFHTIEFQGLGLPHVHGLIFYPYKECDPHADMQIHYDPHSASLMYLMKSQGLSPGTIYRSVRIGRLGRKAYLGELQAT